MSRLPERIDTERLTVRRWTVDDAPALASAVATNREHLRPWMPWVAEEPLGLDDRRTLIAEWQEIWEAGGDAIYGIFSGGDDPVDDVVVGGTGLHHRIGPGGLEIGYWIHLDHCLNGYATEVVEALTEAALSLPGIDRVEIHHDEANEISGRIPRALGYMLVNEAPQEPTAPGEIGISVQWRMTSRAWARLQHT